MAFIDQEKCRLCAEILSKKQRRQIFSDAFRVFGQLVEVIGYKPTNSDGLSKCICFRCFNRLNRISKIDFDLKNRLDQLKLEKRNIICELRKNVTFSKADQTHLFAPSDEHSETQSPTFHCVAVQDSLPPGNHHGICEKKTYKHSPAKFVGKRHITHTPTPRKKKVLKIPPTKTASCEIPKAKRRLNVTEKVLSPFKAKVQVRSATDKLRTRIVKEKGLYAVLVGIVRGQKPSVIAKKLFSIPQMQEHIVNYILKLINTECIKMCKEKDPSILRNTGADHLTSLNFQRISFELHLKAPTLTQFLKCCIKRADNEIALCVLSSLILRYRNNKISKLHHVIGQLLDRGGATDETIEMLSHMGLSVGPDSVSRKYDEMVSRQRRLIKQNVKGQIQQCQLLDKMKKTEVMVANLKAETEPLLKMSQVVDVSSSVESAKPSDAGTSEGLNYFDMCSSYKSHNMTYMSCKSEPLPTKSNCTSNAGCTNTTLHCTVLPQICVPYHSGDITLPSLPLYESYGVSTSPTVQASSKKTLEYATAYLKKNKGSAKSIVAAYDIIGDNVDLMKSPSNKSSKKQRESLHWFLNVAVQRRVVSSLPNDRPISDIMDVPNHAFIPSSDDCDALEKNMVFHILKVATKYVNCLKPYADCVPKYLDHPHIEETSKKTKYFIADLLDKSENKSEEMISILQHIHENYIAHTEDDPPAVIEKRVFGGDVLTNERAYSAQMAMMNSHSDFFRLAGIIHRPEGLHRLMNFLLFIYQEFYKTSSAPEQGTLCQLRNFIHRVDVSGGDGAVDKFRAHYAFVMDCLDAYILGAVFEVMQLENFDGMPIKWRPPPLLMTAEKSDQYQWLTELAQEILEKHVKLNADKNLTRMSEEAKEMDTQTLTMQGMFDNGLQKFVCTCGKQYKTAGYFKRHLVSTHNWLFREDDDPTPDSSTSESKTDSVANYRASFMKNALLLRDTYDAYSMCDGERVVRNAKFEFLCADVRKHNKYKLWLWRFVAYIIALLSPKQAYENMWNCAANTTGGVGKNIPNENLVELMVQLVKKKIKEQGSNFTYSSAVKAALSSQVQEEIKQNLQQEIQQKTKGKSRTKTNKFSDIEVMVLELRKGNVFSYIPGREFPSFKKFQDASERVNLTKLHTWVSKQKERASFEML